ncbi:hypothetical protein DFP72DRAFT_870684 [Ephemerocybe angulata]|uniref:CNH domain-containing protein n=1 Tax=Ephemerocybe angulata TaxID=980116 RepID=A0A8H6MGR4_9AGAR|nr:hypothetical protein DFP72DRAFT_870684 [Tulosesus angulatus]
MAAVSTANDVPPYQVATLLNDFFGGYSKKPPSAASERRGEIYVGTSNGELFRFLLQPDGPEKLESYCRGERPIDTIVLVPSISRALVQSDRQVHFYILPSLEPHSVKPVRNVITFAVDEQQVRRPPPSLNAALGYTAVPDPVDLCAIKRNGIAMFSLKDRLFYSREIPLPQGTNAVLARRTGRYVCFADHENYNIIDLEEAQLFPILPISQAPPESTLKIKPHITVISDNEFLILSWTGASTLGLFITGNGDPVRGTLQWSSYPLGISLDYPYITTLLPDGTIEVHSVESQSIIQVIGPPGPSRPTSPSSPSVCGYQVPSSQRAEHMKKVPVKLLRKPPSPTA